MKMPHLELKDYVSNGLSLIAIAVSILTLVRSDTRISELRQKVLKYSVENGGGDGASGFGEIPDEPVIGYEDVYIEVMNAGSLPVGGVTLSISSQTMGNGHLGADVAQASCRPRSCPTMKCVRCAP